MSYDPNDPKRTDPIPPKVDVTEVYVEPVEQRSSPLPLIIGILLALAVAYFVLQYFMKKDVVVDDPAAATAPAATESTAPATTSR